jgi:hypothetical protein
MINNKTTLIISLVSLSAITACSPYNKHPKFEEAAYWQRSSATSALYQQGPKAQQMLHQDIANCTVEIRELENLGAIRRAIPSNYSNGNTMEKRTTSQKDLDKWDSPERDGYLYAEHLDYSDFEGCMVNKGWERVEYLPYTNAKRARQDYIKNTGRKKAPKPKGGRENVTTLHTANQTPAPYKNLND